MGPGVWLVGLFLLSCCITGVFTSQEDSGGKKCRKFKPVKCNALEQKAENISDALLSLQKEIHDWMVHHSCESSHWIFCVQLMYRKERLSLVINKNEEQYEVGLCSCEGETGQNSPQWNECLCSDDDGGTSPPCPCVPTSESSEDQDDNNSCNSTKLKKVRCKNKKCALLQTVVCNTLIQQLQDGESICNSSSTPATTGPTNKRRRRTSSQKTIIICVVVPICILGLICIVAGICKVQRNRDRSEKNKGDGFKAQDPRAVDVPVMEETECALYNAEPRKKEEDNGHVAYSVTKVQIERPGEGRESTYSADHVYCYIKDPVAKGDGGKTKIQGEENRDPMDAGKQPEASSVVEETPRGQQQPEEPAAMPADQGYSVIGPPATKTAHSHPQADPRAGSLEEDENPDQP